MNMSAHNNPPGQLTSDPASRVIHWRANEPKPPSSNVRMWPPPIALRRVHEEMERLVVERNAENDGLPWTVRAEWDLFGGMEGYVALHNRSPFSEEESQALVQAAYEAAIEQEP